MKKHVGKLTALIVALAIAFTLGSCAHKFDKFAESPLTVTIIQTTDIHGAIFPYNFITGQNMDTSMAQVATVVKEQRARGEVVLLDNGDSLQGQPTVYYYNFEKTDVPHIWTEVLNYLAMTPSPWATTTSRRGTLSMTRW